MQAQAAAVDLRRLAFSYEKSLSGIETLLEQCCKRFLDCRSFQL